MQKNSRDLKEITKRSPDKQITAQKVQECY